MKIGFIGVGSMGAAMVPHLVAGGHEVSVWNRNRTAAELLSDVGILSSPSAAFTNDVVVAMLSNSQK